MSKEFLDYLMACAPEGETVLFVKQKQVGDLFEGKKPTYAYIASLPSHRILRSPGAWFGNTALYVLDRMREKVAVTKANSDRCGFFLFDDVGTKSKEPPIKPTWIMESSPGNFQWVCAYRLDDQPTHGEHDAAFKVIAAAGFTDAGAGNPVRNFRLPGSINLKPENNGFAARLVEFHPERQFSLKEICDALGVTPGEASTATQIPIDLEDDGDDDVLLWLAKRGDLMQAVNGAGWAGVVCPNSGEHTDGNPQGRYSPLTRSYCCLHAHCSHWTSEVYLDWVHRMGGPQHKPGLRDTILADVMGKALSKLVPGDRFSSGSAAAAVIAQAEIRELSRLERDEWFERFAYVASDDAYFDTQTRREVSRKAFNALYRGTSCITIHGGKRRIEASVCFDERRLANGALALEGLTYAAGEPTLSKRADGTYGNCWIDARPKIESAGDPGPWLAHVETLIPNPDERKHLLDALAFKVQNPGVKINHAILLGGEQGCGKDMLFAPFFWAVCGPAEKNKSFVDSKTFDSNFDYSLEAEVMLINELRPDAFKDRRALENTLKPIIAAPPEYLPVNRKNKHPYNALNRILVIAMTNYRDAIALDPRDRRWFVLWTYAPRIPDSEGKKMWDWYKAGGYAAVAQWLHQRDVSAFNPGGAPLMTEAKMIMQQQSQSPAESYLLTCIESHPEFAAGVIAAPVYPLLDRLQASVPQQVKLTQAALLHALKEAGWIDLGRIHSREYPSLKQIYASAAMAASKSRSELRAMVSAPTPVSNVANIMARVK